MVTGGYRRLQGGSDDFSLQTDTHTSSTWTNPTKFGHLLVGLNHARAESHGAVARLEATFLVAARGRPANDHVLAVLLTGLSKKSKKYRRVNLECPFVTFRSPRLTFEYFVIVGVDQSRRKKIYALNQPVKQTQPLQPISLTFKFYICHLL